MSEEIWLQTEQAGGAFLCESFSGVPVARPSWIVLASAGSPQGRAHVAALREELTAILLGASPSVAQAVVTCPAAPEEMRAAQFPQRRKLLVLVASSDAQIKDLAWYSQWSSDADDAAVMTVLPPGNFHAFFDPVIAGDDQHLLSRVGAISWKDKVAEVVPAVLARADVTASTARVFISYRRLETMPLALQLFDRLTHEGFEVFLDRFSIPPGYDFQRRLSQELEDKSMVLLLESHRSKESKWTQHEIDFAKRHRLGLHTLRMPDVVDADGLASVRRDTVTKLQDADFDEGPKSVRDEHGKELKEWQKLKPETLEAIVANVKAAHAQALFERRRRLRGDLVAEMRKQGVQTEYLPAGALLARYNGHDHLLWPVTRPPEVEDFRITHAAHLARGGISPESRGIVIGPQAAQEPERMTRLKWLQKVSGCPSFDEGKLAEFVSCMIAGDWP